MLDDLHAQSYGYFQQEAPELLQTLEHELLSLGGEWSVNKAHTLMRTTHTLKGAAASVGLEGVKSVAHRLEDLFRGLCQPDIVPDRELEALLFEGFECLRQPLTAQLSDTPVAIAPYLERVETILAQVQTKLGDAFQQDAGIPTAAELGFDLTLSIFESGVSQRLNELQAALASQSPTLAELLSTHASIFQGLAESLALPGFKAIADAVITASANHPDEAVTIATLALADWRDGHQAVLTGDRDQGGEPSTDLLALAGEAPSADIWGENDPASADFWAATAPTDNVWADDSWATAAVVSETSGNPEPNHFADDTWLAAATEAPPAEALPEDFWGAAEPAAASVSADDFWGDLAAAPETSQDEPSDFWGNAAGSLNADSLDDDFWATTDVPFETHPDWQADRNEPTTADHPEPLETSAFAFFAQDSDPLWLDTDTAPPTDSTVANILAPSPESEMDIPPDDPLEDSFWAEMDSLVAQATQAATSPAEPALPTADFWPTQAPASPEDPTPILPQSDFWGDLTPPAESEPLVLASLWDEIETSPVPAATALAQSTAKQSTAKQSTPNVVSAKPSSTPAQAVPTQPAPPKPAAPKVAPPKPAPVQAAPVKNLPKAAALPKAIVKAPASPPTPLPPPQAAKPTPPAAPVAAAPPSTKAAVPALAKVAPLAPPTAMPEVAPELEVSTSDQRPRTAASHAGLGSTVAAIAALKAQTRNQLPIQIASTPVAPPPKAPQAPTATVRININHLEALGTSLAELLTNQNRQSLQDEQLQNAVQMLHYRLQQHKALLVQLREWSDQQLIQPSVAGGSLTKGLEWQRQFDSLELDYYNDLQVLAQTIFEDTVQLEEATDAVDLFARQLSLTRDKQQRLLGTTRDVLMEARLLPLNDVLSRFERVLQQLETRYEKPVQLVVRGGEVMIDKTVAEKLYDPLLHIVRNAFDHGLETASERAKLRKPARGQITIRAHHRGTNLFIDVSDDGRGLDYERIRQTVIGQKRITAAQAQALDRDRLSQFLFEPGFSTAATVSDLSGRGVGLDVVKTQLEALQGDVSIQSQPGQGTTFRLQIPLNLTIVQLLLCEVGETPYALLADQVEHILNPRPEQILQRGGDRLLRWGSSGSETLVPLRRLSQLLDYRSLRPTSHSHSNQRAIILVRLGDHLMGLEVDQVLREQELVVRPFSTLVRPPDYIAGGSILADGRLTLVLDGVALLRSMVMHSASPIDPRAETANVPQTAAVLVVEDSVTVRQTLTASLQRTGYSVIQARDGQEAAELLSQADRPIQLIISDVEMPRMNGFELLNFRQSQPHLQAIPMIMLTSRSSTKHQQLALGLGANAYLTKPYLEHQLLNQVAELLA